jgi:hypothetical protein
MISTTAADDNIKIRPQKRYNKNWRVSRVIAGLVIARWLGGRKVRTPSS